MIRLVPPSCRSRSGRLIPILLRSHRTTPHRHRAVPILVVHGLTPDSRGIRRVRGAHVGRRGVDGQLVASGVLGVAGVLGLALPELAFGRAGGVAVVGGGAEGALFATVSDEAVFAGD